MDLRHLAAFHTVATTLNFTRAAEQLNYVQSNVTAQIQSLEAELGVPLFDRIGRRVQLTDAGRRLLPYATQVLTLVAEARLCVRSGEEPVGTVVFTAPESLCTYRLPRFLQRFRVDFPQVHLVFRALPVDQLEQHVRAGDVDVAFVLEEPLTALSLAVEPLAHERVCLLAAPRHPLSGTRPVTAGDFVHAPLLLTEAGCSYRRRFLKALMAAGVRPTTPMEFGSVEAIKQCVRVGMGITVLPAVVVASEVADGRLAELMWDGADLDVVTQMVWHREKWQSPALRAFLQTAREEIPEEVPRGAAQAM